MPEDDEKRRRFDELDALIARRVERRKKVLQLYWALLAAAIVVALLALRLGTNLADDPEFSNDVANKILVQPGLEGVIAEKAASAVASPEFVSGLSAHPVFTGRLDEAAREAASQSTQEISVRLDENLARTTEANEQLRAQVADLEAEQRALSSRIDEQPGGVEEVSAKLDALTKQLGDVASGLEAQRTDLALLSKRLDRKEQSGRMPRSFLLKERGRTPLPGFGLSVELGERDRDGVDSLAVFDANDRLLFPKAPGGAAAAASDSGAGPIRFGESFCFSDSKGGQFFSAVLTNAQHRLFVADWVGLDLWPLPGDAGPDCKQAP